MAGSGTKIPRNFAEFYQEREDLFEVRSSEILTRKAFTSQSTNPDFHNLIF